MTTCKYCGQIIIDGNMCDCPDAIAERKREKVIKEATEIIKETFAAGPEPLSPESIDLLINICKLIANGEIRKATILVQGGIKVNIKTAAKAKIEIERTETSKFKAETETEL